MYRICTRILERDDTHGTQKNKLYEIRVDEETDGKIRVICDKEGISESEAIRQGIELKYLNLEIANQ
ncbi:MAG: ribbon-helix-helix protein, CopG family [Lachnospiraceae bacterium]|nr:ribbon-helix-helix protein, CopG family [Lachnospiraceae bacterium]